MFQLHLKVKMQPWNINAFDAQSQILSCTSFLPIWLISIIRELLYETRTLSITLRLQNKD